MSLRLRSVWRRLIGLHDLRELRAKSANHGKFFTAKRATGGANVDELDDGNKVVDVDGGFRCIGHGSVLVGIFECRDTLAKRLQFRN